MKEVGVTASGVRGVSPKMLAQSLRELEARSLVHWQVFPEVPPRVEYSLTAFGESLAPLLAELCEWSFSWEARLRELWLQEITEAPSPKELAARQSARRFKPTSSFWRLKPRLFRRPVPGQLQQHLVVRPALGAGLKPGIEAQGV